jgi:hypothetical protein
MAGLYAVEVEPEVRSWLERLSDREFGRADFLVGLLAEQAETLGEPGRRIILLTVFRKTRSAEAAEVARALQAQKTCEAEHGPAHDTFNREAS